MKRRITICILCAALITPWHALGAAPLLDTDHDGLSDALEIQLGTDQERADTDNDGFTDGTEVSMGYDPKNNAPTKINKRIEVALDTQRLAYYFGSIKLDEFPISSGIARLPTPPGDYTVLEKRPIVRYKGEGYDFPNTKWNLLFKRHPKGGYYIHGAYWHHNFGHRMSHGCVNVAYSNMEQLYDFASASTTVIIRAHAEELAANTKTPQANGAMSSSVQ